MEENMFKFAATLSICVFSSATLFAYNDNEGQNNNIRNRYEYNLYSQNRDENNYQNDPNNPIYENNNEYMQTGYGASSNPYDQTYVPQGPQPDINTQSFKRLETENIYENPRALTDYPQ
jgi:hypothetical protein